MVGTPHVIPRFARGSSVLWAVASASLACLLCGACDDDGPPPSAASADVGVTIDDGTTATSAGDLLSYEVTIQNSGPSAATGITTLVDLDNEVSHLISSSSQGTWSLGVSVITWDVDALPVGGTATLTVLVEVSSSATGPITTIAIITCNETDDVPANNLAVDTDSIP